MFKTCCGDCGECWYVGNPRTCTCPDETTKRTWVGLTDAEIKDILDCGRGGLVDIKKTEAKLKERNT